MRPSPEVHDALACLLAYPGELNGAHYPAAIAELQRSCPEIEPALATFAEAIAPLDPGELEELYTRTFDNVADRSLEIGWQVFGENYARGALLVRLRALMREHGVPEETELPDHLTHVLRLLGHAPATLAAALASNQVGIAVDKILAGLRSYESPWTSVLEATHTVIEMHAPEGHVTEALGR